MRRAVLWGTVALLTVPILVVVLYSFNGAESSPRLGRLTLGWYHRALQDGAFLEGLRNSLIVSSAATLLSALIGVPAALAARLGTGPSRLLTAASIVPLLTPELLVALGSASVYQELGLKLGLWTVVLAHSSFGVPLFFLLTDAALASGRFEELVQAARDLGATPGAAVRKVVLPLLWPYLVSTAALVWALSIDDVVLAFFLGGDRILTVWLYSLVRTRGISAEINVACVTLLVLVLSIWAAGLIVRRKFAEEASS